MKSLFTFLAVTLTSLLFAQDFERLYPDIEIGSVSSINIHESGIGYAPQECGSMLKTVDGGVTWTQIFPDVSDAAYQGFVVFLDDNDPDKLVYYSQYTLIKTDDGFVTSESIKPNPISGLMQDFIVLENGNYGLLANTFFYSSDEGDTWMETASEDVDGTAMIEFNGALYLAYRAILRSTDGGVTFDTVFHNSDTKRKFVILNDKPIVSSSNELYTSNDDGLSWEIIPSMDYYGSAGNLNAYDGRLIANSSNRINYSDDEGLTWVSVIMPTGVYRTSSMFVNDTGRIYIGGEASQIYVTDDPDIPIEILFGEQDELNYITGHNAKLVATGNNGVLMRSEDNGNTWAKYFITDRNLDLSSYIEDRLFVYNDNNELLLVGDDNSTTVVLDQNDYFISFEAVGHEPKAFLSTSNSIFRTDDGGDNWSEVYTHSGNIAQMHLNDDGDVFILDRKGAIYISEDNGASWELNSSSPDTNMQFLDFVVFDEISFMVMSTSMLFSTIDGGTIWESAFRPYNGQRLYGLDNESALCLGVNGSNGWLYKTDDKGETFPQIAQTCSTTSRGAFYNTDTQTFWTVGSGLGIQKVQLMINGTRNNLENISAIQVYPNPGYDIIYLNTPLAESSTVSIFNMLGSRVKTVKGTNRSIDISSLAPGQYQIVIQNGQELKMSKFVKL